MTAREGLSALWTKACNNDLTEARNRKGRANKKRNKNATNFDSFSWVCDQKVLLSLVL